LAFTRQSSTSLLIPLKSTIAEDYNIPGTPRLTIIPTEQWDGFEFAHTLRSFDPCFVCGIHVVTPDGRVRFQTLGAPVDLSNVIRTFYKFAMQLR
jgi:hydrogenase large subunit